MAVIHKGVDKIIDSSNNEVVISTASTTINAVNDATTGLASKASTTDLTTGLAAKSDSTHNHALANLTDVDVSTSPTANQTLKWINSKWTPSDDVDTQVANAAIKNQANTFSALQSFESGLATEFIQAASPTGIYGTFSSTNVFKIGTFSNLQNSFSAEIVILGTALYGTNANMNENDSGKTTILLRGDASETQASPTDSLSGFFYSELERNRETGHPSAGMGCENVWFVPNGAHSFDIYVKYIGGWAGLETFVRCSQGVTFASDVVDTGVETAPTNGVALPSRWTLGVHGEQALEVTQDNVYAQQQPVVTLADIGTAPNNIPLNQHLGSMAYLNLGNYIQSGKTTLFVKGMDADPTVPVSDTLLFQRIGNQVTVYFSLNAKDTTGVAGFGYLTGLPYKPTNKIRHIFGHSLDSLGTLVVNPSTITRDIFYSCVNGQDTGHADPSQNARHELKASLDHKIIYFRSYDLGSSDFVEFKSGTAFYLNGNISYMTDDPFDPTLGGL